MESAKSPKSDIDSRAKELFEFLDKSSSDLLFVEARKKEEEVEPIELPEVDQDRLRKELLKKINFPIMMRAFDKLLLKLGISGTRMVQKFEMISDPNTYFFYEEMEMGGSSDPDGLISLPANIFETGNSYDVLQTIIHENIHRVSLGEYKTGVQYAAELDDAVVYSGHDGINEALTELLQDIIMSEYIIENRNINNAEFPKTYDFQRYALVSLVELCAEETAVDQREFYCSLYKSYFMNLDPFNQLPFTKVKNPELKRLMLKSEFLKDSDDMPEDKSKFKTLRKLWSETKDKLKRSKYDIKLEARPHVMAVMDRDIFGIEFDSN